MRRVGIVLLIAMAVVFAGNVNAQITLDEASQKQMAMTNLSSMPLAFTENRGQWDEKAMFKADAGGATFWFCGDEIAYVFTRDTDELLDNDGYMLPDMPDMPDKFDRPRYKKESLVIRAQLIGANPNAEIIGENRLSHNCNYFYGNDPSKWRSDVPNYAFITYKDIYPGIDLKYHGNGQGMKYDFIVNSGADVSQIQIRYEGADNLAITPNGDLEAITLFGPIHENIPSVYQEIGDSKREVTGRYIIRAPGVFGFEVDDYDPSLTLVIDPELVYSTYLGGNNEEKALEVAVDGNGSAYVTGYTYSIDFPTTENAYQTDQPDRDAFVTKLAQDGGSLVYSTYLGGNASDNANRITVDDNGYAYIAGSTLSDNFPTENPYQPSLLGNEDAFVTKLSLDGTSLVYSTYLGGGANDYGQAIAVDSSGNAYVAGDTYSINFPTVNPFQTDQPDRDSYVTKFAPDGDSLIYSTYLGGDDEDHARAIAVDEGGNAYITGCTSSSDFPTENPYQTEQPAGDVFITKLAPEGSSLIYSTYLGGSDNETGRAIYIDNGGCAYVTGETYSNNFPTSINAYQTSLQGNIDVFITKLTPAGNALSFSTYLGGSGTSSNETGRGIHATSNGYVIVAGFTISSDFPITDDAYQTDQPNIDAFFTIFVPDASSLVYSTYLGGDNHDYGYGLAVDNYGNAYITGWTYSTNFPTVNPFDDSHNGDADLFIAKFGPTAEPIPALSEWGMIVLALLVLAIGTVAVIRRRRAVVAE